MTDGYLRFGDEHAEPILEREKTSTIRYGFERELEEGDVVELRDSAGSFARAEILIATTITAEHVVRLDLDGHRSYADVGHLSKHLREYYGDEIPHRGLDRDAELHLFVFDVTERLRPPLEPIRDFVRRQLETDDVDGAAEAIAKAIQKHGKPSPFDVFSSALADFEPPSFSDVFGQVLDRGKSAEQIVDEIDALLEDPYGELGLEDERPLPLVVSGSADPRDDVVDALRYGAIGAGGIPHDAGVLQRGSLDRGGIVTDQGLEYLHDALERPDCWITIDEDDVDDETLERIRAGRVEGFSIGFDRPDDVE